LDVRTSLNLGLLLHSLSYIVLGNSNFWSRPRLSNPKSSEWYWI